MTKSITILDTETNGFKGSSVLSVCAFSVDTWIENQTREFKCQEQFERYYFPEEPFNPGAIRVNGLKQAILEQKRKGQTYPRYFREDPGLKSFCQESELLVCHNVNFDYSFLPFKFPATFCTMLNLTDYCKLKNPHSFYHGYKWPRLNEAADILEVCYDASGLHDATVDTKICFELFKKMANMSEFREKINDIL